jgi:flagellar biosynthetic protein FliR
MSIVPTALLAASPAWVTLFVLAMGRVGGLFLLAPIFGSRLAPVRVRAALVFFLALTMLPVLSAEHGAELAATATPLTVLAAMAREVAIGAAIGLAAQFVFSGMQLAGQLAGIQMGTGLSNLVDPQSGEQLTTLAQFANVLALLVFLGIDGHHMLIHAVADSFAAVGIGGGLPSVEGIGMLLVLAGSIFVIALKLSAPVMLLVLLVNAAMGVLAKVIPQLNVFIVGFPLNVAAGLFGMVAALPYAVELLTASFGDVARATRAFLEALS